MAASSALGGIAYLKIDGQQYRLRGSFKIRKGGTVRTAVTGADAQVHGWSEKYESPGFDVEVTDSGDLSTDAIQAITASTVTLEMNSGKVWIAESAFQTDMIEIDGVEAKFAVKFGCLKLVEVTT